MKPIHTTLAPAAIGPYSQAIDSGAGLVFVSGQLPIDPATGAFPEGGVAEFFAAPFPARSAFAVKDLPKGALVEIECIAAR